MRENIVSKMSDVADPVTIMILYYYWLIQMCTIVFQQISAVDKVGRI